MEDFQIEPTPEDIQVSYPTSAPGYKVPKWYNNPSFRILPYLKIRKADRHNTWNATFEWLFLKVWTMDSFGFALEAVIDGHWGIGFTASLPYTRIVLAIPMPIKWAMWIQEKLWRRNASEKESIATAKAFKQYKKSIEAQKPTTL